MLLRIFLLLIIIFSSHNLLATHQIADTLIYEGNRVPIFTLPLDSYFDANHPKPKSMLKAICSACWRGYIATWEIKGDNLYLIKVIEGSCLENASDIPLSQIFPDKKSPIKAIWFSGQLKIPHGKEIKNVHKTLEPVYEKSLYLTIKEGKVTKREVINNSPEK